MQTRRERARMITVAQIKAAALTQVARDGAASLSIRGIAREIGLSPAGMYRYYASRDDLLTDLLVDAYEDLATAVAAAAGLSATGPPPADPVAALLRAIQAYRAWAVAEPGRFLLIFGTPVPGYEAPPEGPTVLAVRRMGQAYFTLVAQAWAAGRIRVPGPEHHPQQGEPDVLAGLRALAPDFPAALVPRMLAGWALWHGLTTLEVTGQLHWVYPDAGLYFTERMGQWLDEFTGRTCDGRPGAEGVLAWAAGDHPTGDSASASTTVSRTASASSGASASPRRSTR